MTTVIQPRADLATMPDALTYDDMLAIIQAEVGDVHFRAQMEDPNGAGNVYRAIAEVFAAVSEVQAVTFRDGHLLSSDQGEFATGQVEITRSNIDGDPVTLLRGSLVGTEDGRLYLTLTDAVFGQGDQGPRLVDVRSISQVYHANTPGEYTTASGEVVPGLINQLVLPFQDPPGADLSMHVVQRGAVDGARPNSISAHGENRAMPRLEGESVEDYRARLSQLLTGITQEGIEQALRYVLTRLGVSYTLIPGWRWDWNAPADLDRFIRSDFPESERYGLTEDFLFGFVDDPRYEFSLRQRVANDDGAGVGIVLLAEDTEPGPGGRYREVLSAVYGLFGAITAYGYETLAIPEIPAPLGPVENARVVPLVTIQSAAFNIWYFDESDVPNYEASNVSTWDMGDGTIIVGTSAVAHPYSPGTYTITVHVRNDIGVLLARGTLQHTVT